MTARADFNTLLPGLLDRLLHAGRGQRPREAADRTRQNPQIGRDVAACRQLASKARAHVRAERPRFVVDRASGLEIAAAFFRASSGEEVAALGALLAEDVRFHADGGGLPTAVARVLEGAAEVTRAYTAIVRLRMGSADLVRLTFVNGLPGRAGQELQTTALLVGNVGIRAIYVMRHLAKLGGLEGALQ